eukprot:SAG31_NODE_2651_length_5296_cov_2.101770_5_plen_58_part_00
MVAIALMLPIVAVSLAAAAHSCPPAHHIAPTGPRLHGDMPVQEALLATAMLGKYRQR